MPRSNRPRRGGRPRPGPAASRGSAPGSPSGAGGAEQEAVPLGGGTRLEEHPDGTWAVRRISGAATTKAYRCPGCQQEILPGTPHVVVWPALEAVGAFGGPEDRRHWHSPCWASRARRVRRPS